MSTVRGCPPRGLCLAGGISGSTMAHFSSVRSEGYLFRDWSSFHIRAHSSADGICANYLTNILFCQTLFPDSLLEWTGWIRDKLSGNHAPIYLVGPLSLGHAERSLLARRGVTPIDLAPVFSGMQPPNSIHAASIEWFLRSLAAARPPRPEKWRDLESGSPAFAGSHPPVLDVGEVAPTAVELAPDAQNPLTPETAAKIAARWQFERLKYPGWVIAAKDKRSSLW